MPRCEIFKVLLALVRGLHEALHRPFTLLRSQTFLELTIDIALVLKFLFIVHGIFLCDHTSESAQVGHDLRVILPRSHTLIDQLVKHLVHLGVLSLISDKLAVSCVTSLQHLALFFRSSMSDCISPLRVNLRPALTSRDVTRVFKALLSPTLFKLLLLVDPTRKESYWKAA